MSRDRDPEFDVGIECRHAHATWLRLGNRGDLADRYAYGSAFNQGLLDEGRAYVRVVGKILGVRSGAMIEKGGVRGRLCLT